MRLFILKMRKGTAHSFVTCWVFTPLIPAEDGLIFELPPAELGIHPAEEEHQELYLICDHVEETIQELNAKGVECSEIQEARWGLTTVITLPSGGKLCLYEPRHRTAFTMK